MNLDPDRCYRAICSRDRRFDGRFFTAVRTTGIYCRPICPARTPRRTHVRFYHCAAAAEEAGFRPCRRCHPEASPGTPAWLGTSVTVGRALRLIAAGALDDDDTERLAARLGVGPRHLRRLFVRQLGAPPRAVGRCRRVHLARRLLAETALPMGQVAQAAGFPSIRRFNEAIRTTFRATPTELRRRSDHRPHPDDAVLTLRLPYRPPMDAAALIRFLAPRAIPAIETVEAGIYKRVVVRDGRAAVITVDPDPDGACLRLQVPVGLSAELAAITARVRRLFDLDADPLPIESHLRSDPILGAAVRRRPGLRIPGCWDRFEIGVRAILGQQITVAGATTLIGRLVERLGPAVKDSPDPALCRRFPAPATVAAADLRGLGLPGARAETVRRFAATVSSGTLSLDGSCHLDDLVARLVALPGIGDWTAQYIALRAAGEPDAFPAGDLGLRRAAAAGGVTPAAGVLRRRADAWRPWRGYAAIHLWSLAANHQAKPTHRKRKPNRRTADGP